MKSRNLFIYLLLFCFFLPFKQSFSQINEKYLQMGGQHGILGEPKMKKIGKAKDGGQYMRFSNGMIYWHPTTDACALHGEILKKYRKLNNEKGLLGYPKTDVKKTDDKKGQYCFFQGGAIFWTKKHKAVVVKRSPFLEKWNEIGLEQGVLGYPVKEAHRTPDKKGQFQVFEHGSIYCADSSPPHVVHGGILRKWKEFDYERGMLGYPLSDELDTPDHSGKFQIFERGNIYWAPNIGAHEVHGAILKKYGEFGFEQGPMGYPTFDERVIGDDKRGKVAHFEDGVIYWTPETGAHGFYGKAARVISSHGLWQHHVPGRYYLGFPTSDAIFVEDGLGAFHIEFENGKMLWAPSFDDDNKVMVWYNIIASWVDEKYYD